MFSPSEISDREKSRTKITRSCFLLKLFYNENERNEKKLTNEIKEFGIVFNFVLERSQYTQCCASIAKGINEQKKNDEKKSNPN